MTTGRHREREIAKTTKADGTDPKFPQARFLSINAGPMLGTARSMMTYPYWSVGKAFGGR